jgi:AcrR family transcriptional regulator
MAAHPRAGAGDRDPWPQPAGQAALSQSLDSQARELSGDKVQRIVDAMRHCVAERGVAGATFEQVSREAGVSRGLLHYYFGTKERLLIEVLRNDAETRIAMLDQPLAAAKTADEVIAVLVSGAEGLLREDPGFYVILYELFTAGRQNPEIQAELAELYQRSRRHVALVLRQKEAEGVLSLRFDAESVVTYMFAAADGGALQRLTDPERDYSATVEVGAEVASFLLSSD